MLTSCPISLTFKCHSTAVVLAEHLVVTRKIILNRACLSFCAAVSPGVRSLLPSLLPSLHSWNWIIVSLNFGMLLETFISCVWESQITWEMGLGNAQKFRFAVFLHKSCIWEKYSFFISNNFISHTRLRLAKIKQKLGNTLRLNFCYLKIMWVLHPWYHPKLI